MDRGKPLLRLLYVLFALATSLGAQQDSLITPNEFFHEAGAGLRAIEQEQRGYWQPHVENSRRRILEAAALCERRSVALVLGAGNCTEIPIEELARRFEHVVLVDLDTKSMLDAVEDLPEELWPKFSIEARDVTAFVSPLMERLQAIVAGSNTAEEALRTLSAAADALDNPGSPAALPAADLVVSSLVLSELHRYPMSYADRLLRDKFQRRLADWSGREPLRVRLQRLAVEDHVRLLAALVHPGGAVYYADTVARGPVHDAIGPQAGQRILTEISPKISRMELYRQIAGDEALRQSFLTGFKNMRPRWGDDSGASAEGVLKSLVEGKPLPDSDSGAASELIVSLSCRERFPISREIEVFELFLQECAKQPGAFEPLVPLEYLAAQWKVRGLRPQGDAESWWWLEYPCSIASSSGAFQIESWILRRGE